MGPHLGFDDHVYKHLLDLRTKLEAHGFTIVKQVPKRRDMHDDQNDESEQGGQKEVAPWYLVSLVLRGSTELLWDLSRGRVRIELEQSFGAPLRLVFPWKKKLSQILARQGS